MSKQFFQAIQFGISTRFSSIWPLDRTLSGATAPDQSGPAIDGNEGVLCIPQSSNITGASPSDCLVSYSGHSFGGGRISEFILQPQPSGQSSVMSGRVSSMDVNF